MSRRSQKGQALTEYLLTVAVLLVVFWAGLRLWTQGLRRAEDAQAWFLMLPSP